jgi:hypothetical protein
MLPSPSWSAKADHPRLTGSTEESHGSSAFAEDDGRESLLKAVGIISNYRSSGALFPSPPTGVGFSRSMDWMVQT